MPLYAWKTEHGSNHPIWIMYKRLPRPLLQVVLQRPKKCKQTAVIFLNLYEKFTRNINYYQNNTNNNNKTLKYVNKQMLLFL